MGVVILMGSCPSNEGSCPIGVIALRGTCHEGLLVLGGNWQRSNCPRGVIVLWGSCPWGSYPRASRPIASDGVQRDTMGGGPLKTEPNPPPHYNITNITNKSRMSMGVFSVHGHQSSITQLADQ